MTNKEASFLLGACRPNGADSGDPEFAQALAQAATDPALKTWMDGQRRFDSAIAARVQSITLPADLRSRILTGGRVSRPAPSSIARRVWAIAAVVTLFAGIGAWFSIQTRRASHEWEDQALAVLGQLVSGQAQFDATSPDVAELQRWLGANGSPGKTPLPVSIQRLASLGCKTITYNGHPISIICFHGQDGELVHLAMTARSSLRHPPPEGSPIYESRDGWNLATWSQGGMAMMLATRAPESQLHDLLGILLAF
jgi:hypothetical protein